MGIYFSSETSDRVHHVEPSSSTRAPSPRRLTRTRKSTLTKYFTFPVSGRQSTSRSNFIMDSSSNQYNTVAALDAALGCPSRKRKNRRDTVLDEQPEKLKGGRDIGRNETAKRAKSFLDADDYARQREEIQLRESSLAFDYLCQTRAPQREKKANEVIQAVKRWDNKNVYGVASKRRGYRGQEHPRFAGDHFLSNVELIKETRLYHITQKMPKGAHLHIHFNANLRPEVLIDIAKEMERMFVTSDISLAPVSNDTASPEYYDRLHQCKIRFSILSPEKERPGNIFSPDYGERETMRFKDFRDQFNKHYNGLTVDKWLQEKAVFDEEEAHNLLQTQAGAWQKFNARTQMMKGLFNYETAYRKYMRLCLQEFEDENIQYAEIRPNFMRSNQVSGDDGTESMDNKGIMAFIIEECEAFLREKPASFRGLKVIYCSPRVFSKEEVRDALDECLEFKKRWPTYIAGFDLVGEEGQGHPLKTFAKELIEFKKNCAKEGVDIPFLFHCGETIGAGDETDGNLIDALLLGAKRIGHGYALPRHPYVMEQMKKQNVCVELCPISNEVLGLTPRVGGHAMYGMLANNMHCTVSTDNGSFFSSRLSHDFYQVFVGKEDMTLHGWRQLIEWSIEHACMEEKLRKQVFDLWESRWTDFCEWIIRDYGHLLNEVSTDSDRFTSN